MNIYDFDNTIYCGDSSIDFFKYCLQINKKCVLSIPKIIFFFILYMIKVIDKEKFKSTFLSIVKYFDDIDQIVLDFWEINIKNIKTFYIKQKKKSDIIISASPSFLLIPIAEYLEFNLIATRVNKKTGKLESKNCYGKEKVFRLKKENSIDKCNKFYSDSLTDTPLANIAKEAYIVKKEEIIEWGNYYEGKLKKLKRIFFTPDFFTFVFIGFINSLNGICIAYVYSLYISNSIISYILGFFTSLCISYVLNSTINFKIKLSLNKFIAFLINNIPNFIIQISSVYVFIELLNLPKLISYSISAIIAVPITFVLIKLNVYNNKEIL